MLRQKFDKRKVALVGTGMVGMSYAYSMLNSNNICDELLLIDINKEKAWGEAMDLNHGLAFSNGNMKIYAGDYSDCADADIVTICAGVPRKPGDSRLDLLSKNVEIFRSIIEPIMKSGFDGCFLIATNPVDVMSYVTQKLSGLAPGRIIGSGTALDTARLRYLLSDYFNVDPRNVHAYVIGEHGDSGFVPWSQAKLGTSSISRICEQSNGKYTLDEMSDIALEVKNVAANIIKAKRATYYSIGMALKRITRAILSDERSILTLSVMPTGQYDQEDVYIGLPCIVGRNGVDTVLELDLTDKEKECLNHSCKIIRDLCHKVKI